MVEAGVYTIPPECPFAETLAAHVIKSFGGDPLSLSRVTPLRPTRRACLAMRGQFLKLSGGKPLLLPSMAPLGDVDVEELSLHLLAEEGGDENSALLLPPAPPLKSLLMLAELVGKFYAAAFGQDAPRDHCVWLARELSRFLDEVEREELSLEALEKLVPELFAGHWQQSVAFLSILSEHYDPLLRGQNLVSPVARRNRLLHVLAKRWRSRPPKDPVIIAGSTGTNPATANLMRVVAGLPQGVIVLPGLDMQLSEGAWEQVGETHPQYTLKLLLERIQVGRETVKPIAGDAACHPERLRLLSHAMLPAGETSSWPSLAIDFSVALADVEYIPCDTSEAEAQVVALILRDALEVPEKTAALITHDRALARRVAGLIRRYGVTIDDSAGKKLDRTEAGAFFRLALEAAFSDAAPVPLLALLKHPLARMGLSAPECRRLARLIERMALRGTRPPGDLSGIRTRLEKANTRSLRETRDIAAAIALVDNLEHCFEGMRHLSQGSAPLESFLASHLRCAQMLSADELGESVLAQGEGGEALILFAEDAILQASIASPLPASAYPGVLAALMDGISWRPVYGQHPRLHILSPQEARLQHFDRVILAGLNEGSWPPLADTDPWMSRPKRRDFGLPSLEKKISQAAHDFQMLWQVPELFLTRALKSEGAAAMPSRWIARLEALIYGKSCTFTAQPWQGWVHQMQEVPVSPAFERPAPVPPLAARPRSLSVTRIETLLRDPYALYATHILNLRRLAPIDEEVNASHFGNWVHDALARFSRHHPEELPPGALAVLLSYGKEAFQAIETQPLHHALWWVRFERIAAWVIQEETMRRPSVRQVIPETTGELRFDAPGGSFALKARADRIELTSEGSLLIIDYKTGIPPAARDIESGYACQLPLEALIAEAEGFTGASGHVTALEYWQLKGTAEGGRIQGVKNLDSLKKDAQSGLQALIARYDNPSQPYVACPRLEEKPKYNEEYEHLERLDEWSGL